MGVGGERGRAGVLLLGRASTGMFGFKLLTDKRGLSSFSVLGASTFSLGKGDATKA